MTDAPDARVRVIAAVSLVVFLGLLAFMAYVHVPMKARCLEHVMITVPTVAPSRVVESLHCTRWEVIP